MADLTLVYVQNNRTGSPGSSPDLVNATMPLGCLYLITALQSRGYSVDFRDYQFCQAPDVSQPETLIAFIENSANIIGISCLVDYLPLVVLALKQIKKRYPEKTIILGGPGPSEVAEPLMSSFPFLDIVCIGEGENTIVELMDALTQKHGLETVRGILYRAKSRIFKTPPRPRISNLDELDFPHPRGVDLTRYGQAGVITSRGCPFHCSYCDVSPLWDRKTTYRSIPKTIEEIKALGAMGIRRINIQDDTFILNRQRALHFSRQMASTPGAPQWSCLGRVDLADEELLTALKEGGCVGMFFGIESGSDQVLQDINKNTTAEISINTVRTAYKYFNAKCYFIWGFPTESTYDLSKTILLIHYFMSMGVATALSLLAPLPKSELRRKYLDRLELNPKLFAYNYLAHFVQQSSATQGELQRLIRAYPTIFSSFYSFPINDLETKLRLISHVHAMINLLNIH